MFYNAVRMKARSREWAFVFSIGKLDYQQEHK